MAKVETAEAVGSPRLDRSFVFVTLAIGAIAAAIAFSPAVFNDGDTSKRFRRQTLSASPSPALHGTRTNGWPK
jgi:hypothetical protein